jgi:eukaryotic-like serine/threonine-protein kinase
VPTSSPPPIAPPPPPLSSSSGQPQVPGRLAGLEVLRRLGAGGMAEVFLAKKRGAEGTFKVLVVKRILPTHGASRRFRSMFVEEAHVATRLNHPNVVQVYEFFDGGDEGQLLAMEYVEGPDLGMLMSSAKKKGTRIPPWIAAWIVSEAAKGLHYAHEKKDEGGARLEIVHRDVSPQNVLLSFEGGVKIADFGIASAKLFSDETGVLKGKFGYMSPEQARGETVDRRSDLYALGVILWECLTGRPLHGGLGGEALLDIVRSGTVEPASTYVRELPAELEAITMKALSPKREERFSTGRDMSSAILRALLAKQELVDASTLEAVIGQIVAREGAHPDSPGLSVGPSLGLSSGGDKSMGGEGRTQAAVPIALSSLDGSSAPRPPVPEGENAALAAPAESPPIGPREVRHVAVVTLRLHGLADDGKGGARDDVALAKAVQDLRVMLGEIAYKRGTRWIWDSGGDARALTGLSPNARAASDAAWLALDTHEAICAMREDLPAAITASIGIVRGIASGRRDPLGNLVRYTLHDPASHLADVIGRATPDGRTWVASGVFRLVRREFHWSDAPTLELAPAPGVENLSPTMRVYALERSLSREEKVAQALSAPSDLVGRDAEKAELSAAYREAVSAPGGGAVTCRAVVGELGIGKTALVATFLAELPPNARLVRAECSPVRMEVPYATMADIVRDAIGTTNDEPFEEVAAVIAYTGGGSANGDASSPMVTRLAELVTNRARAGVVVAEAGPQDDEDAQYRKKQVTDGVRNLLAAIATERPVVLVVDGLEWADKPSLELLGELTASREPLPILVVLITRAEERVAALLEGKVRIELQGLAGDQQMRLVEARLGVREGVRQVCAELLPRVGGNPFYLLEMIDALLERGALEIREGTGGEPGALVRTERAAAGFLALPHTLEQLLDNRLHELPAAERAVVDWLAIAGGPLAIADVVALTGVSGPEAVVRLCARGLCDRRGEAVDFRHPLTRDVATQALGNNDRRHMHQRLGEHLAQTSLARGLSAAIVARHLTRGEGGARAAELYLEAANAARAGYQAPLAVKYYHRALSLLPPTHPQRLNAHEALEAIYRALGRRRDRVQQIEALRRLARHLAQPRPACLALIRTARFHLDEGKLAQGLAVARRAAELAHAGHYLHWEIEAEELVSELLRELGDVQGALAASDRALAACDPKVNPGVPPRARAEVLRSRGVLLRRVGRVREAVDVYVDAIAVFRRVDARSQEARAKNALANAMFVQGRYEDAIALLFETIRIDLSIGGRFQLAKSLGNVGQAYARVGDFPRAVAYLKRARDAHERYGDQDGRSETLVVTAEVLVEQGDLDGAEGFLKDAHALNAATGNAYDITHAAVAAAALARCRRDAKAAIHHATVARRAAESHVLVSFHFYALALEAAARVDAGEMHAATLAATTALGTVQQLQGCEYGLEIRVLCADALKRAASPQAGFAHEAAVDYATALMNAIRDPRLRRRFSERPMVAGLFEVTPVPMLDADGRAPSIEHVSLPELPLDANDLDANDDANVDANDGAGGPRSDPAPGVREPEGE